MTVWSRARALTVAALLLAGCQPSLRHSELTPLAGPTQLQAAEPRVSGVVPAPEREPQAFEARGTGVAPATPATAPTPRGASGDVTLNFVDMDIREIARTILGTMLKVNYTIDPGVHGTASLETGKPLPRSALISTLETLLNQNGATVIERDGIYRVMPMGAAGAANAIATARSVGAGAEVVPLRYASAKDLAKLLEPYVAEGGKITADPARNALIVSGDTAARQTLLSLIAAFDIDVLAGQSYALFPVKDGSPDKLAAELDKVFQSENEGALAGVVRVLPMERVNAVLVVSSQPRYIADAQRFFRLAGQVENATARTWHVYYVQNGQSADLENILQRAFTPRNVTSSGEPGSTTPAAQQATMNAGRTAAAGTTGGLLGGGNAGTAAPGLGAAAGAGAATPAAATARANQNPAAESLSNEGDTGGNGTPDRIRIIANRRNNALLIYATPNEYSVIEGMLRKIDIIPLQVLIEATIAEVTLNDQLAYGTQFFLGGKVAGTLGFNNLSTAAGSTSTTTGATTTAGTTAATTSTLTGNALLAANAAGAIANNFPGFVLNYGSRAAINALSQVTQLKVLSSPQVMVLDNEPARLQVGNLVPIITGSSQSTLTSGAPIVNNVDYRETGVIMQVTPRVNSGGLVTLDIAQEVSDVLNTTSSTINSPTFDERLIRTRVAVQDGQTVGMAGLIRDSDTESNAGIPWLKDIPLLGILGSSQNNNRARTELLVLITPHIVHDQRDALSLTEDLRTQLINAGLVPQDLAHRPLSGSANPNGW
ncbi:MAG: type II secretion system secretin GspD [Alphaproteobacteria bacterium]|nr:type II secretion system secretin GspD [Alphaproteobacteria bacterium]